MRATGDAAGLIARIRQEASAVDRSVPLYKMSTMNRLIDQSLSQERLIAMLASFFGGLALLLVCVGLYGVMSYTVVRRTREIGIRMALGAQPGTVRRQVLRETLWLVAGGISIGVPAVLASARLVSTRRMRACGRVDRRRRPYSIRGRKRSSAYRAWPVRCAHELTFGRRRPMTLNSLTGAALP